MIKVFLITGFLGAGKTTFLKEAFDAFKGMKTGAVVNEFGDINIDGMVLRREGIKLAELTGGSIFCSCIKDKFVDSLIEMSKMDMDIMFIEASGLADPANMGEIIAGIKHKTGDVYDYKGSLCIADGESFAELSDILIAVKTQVEFASAVIINKIDLIDDGKLEKVKAKIREINPLIPIYGAVRCKLDIKKVIADMEPSGKPPEKSKNTPENRAETFVVKGQRAVGMDALKGFIKDIAGESYRVKGFCITEEGPVRISASGTAIEFFPWKEEIGDTKIVVISAIGFRMMSVILRSIEKNAKGIFTV
ncbi:MAG TPA: GTP-binding protein [Bacillota bacterium]|nr:GTP-binding protein [Bacillota bacterium]HUM56175.1 GTP-binding protein [Bacillota bacterium]